MSWKGMRWLFIGALLFLGVASAALEGVDTRSGNPTSVNISNGGLQTNFPAHAVAVTTSDDTTYEEPSVIYVPSARTVRVEPLLGGNTVDFEFESAGFVPVVVKRVLTSGTTVTTGMVRLY